MLHGCGKWQGQWMAVLLLSFLGFQPAWGSIRDRMVPVLMKDGSVQSVTLKDAFLGQGVPGGPLEEAFDYFDENHQGIGNKNFLTIIDLSRHSSQERLFLGNLQTGKVERHVVAHGRGSDPDHDGMADKFSNVPQSQASSLGFYRVAETYSGKHGYSVRMDGLSQTNSNARARAIVIHGAAYVQRGLPKMGRSFGCPAIEQSVATSLINRVKDGSLLMITDGR